MKNNLIWILLLIIPLITYSQTIPREIIRGQVISDSLQVESITVENITSKNSTVTDNNGNFAIYARETDTLYFSALAFRDAELVLTKSHFVIAKIIVKLDVDTNVLDEAIVTNLTGSLKKESEKIKEIKLNPKIDTGKLLDPNDIRNYQFVERNNALPITDSQAQGIDFKRIYKLIFKKKKGNSTVKVSISQKPFEVVVKERFTNDFFTQTLKIPYAEIELFIAFCNNGDEAATLLSLQQEFHLIDYLVTKSIEYLKKGK